MNYTAGWISAGYKFMTLPWFPLNAKHKHWQLRWDGENASSVGFDLYHVKTNKAFNWLVWVQRKFIEQLPVTQQKRVYFLKAGGFKHKQSKKLCSLYSDMAYLRTVKMYKGCNLYYTAKFRLKEKEFYTLKNNGAGSSKMPWKNLFWFLKEASHSYLFET